MSSAAETAGSVTHWAVFKRLAVTYAICWASFFVIAVIVRSNGGVVHLQSAVLAPIVPLFVVGKAVAQSGAWAVVVIVAVVILPPALIALAVRRPDHPLLAKLALSVIVAYWLLLLFAMSLGA